jgi:outer membrane protein insertion porin family
MSFLFQNPGSNIPRKFPRNIRKDTELYCNSHRLIISFLCLCLAHLCIHTPLLKAQDALKIVGYDITGNQNISDEVVLLSIVSRAGDVYTKDLIERDIDALKRLGYFFYINADAVPYKDGLKIIFAVHENPVINGIEIKGNTLVSTEDIKKCIEIEAGLTLNLSKIHEAMLKINKLYQDKGYSYCGILNKDQIAINQETNTLLIEIAEPKLRNTTVTGNSKTKNFIVLREIEIKRGQVIKAEKMRRSLRNIFNLQFFEDVKPPQPRLSEDRQFVDFELQVKEQKTGQASFGGGYSSVNGMIGFIDVAETNFQGRGQTLRAKLQFGGEQRYQLDFLEPWYKGTPVSVGASLFNMSYEREEIRDGSVLSRFEEGRKGASIRTGWRVGKDKKLSLRLTREIINVEAIEIPGTGVIQLPEDLQDLDEDTDNRVQYNQGTARITWEHDARDNKMNASKGYRLSLSASHTGGILQEGLNSFDQYTTDYRTYSKGLGKDLIAAIRIKGGTTVMREGDLFFIDRFTLGGGETLRGYEDHEFTGDKFLLGNFELRKTLGKTFGITLFYDYGDAFGMDGQKSFDGKGAYGVGLRLNTPMGPFRLDFAQGTEYDRGSMFHFGIGQQF